MKRGNVGIQIEDIEGLCSKFFSFTEINRSLFHNLFKEI